MERDLELGLAGQQWVFLSYALTLAALLLVAGGVGDRFGRRETFVAGVGGFALTSLLVALAPGEASVVAARALQGAAAAFVTTNSLALLRETYGSDAGRAIGIWTSLTSVSTIVGPPAGGALVEWASWRWAFLINLPLALAALVLALAGRCRERTHERAGRLDLAGSVTSTIAFAALTYGLVEGGERGFGAVWWTFPLAAAAFAAFAVAERRASEPLVPGRLLAYRNVLAANVETFLVYAALGAVLLFLGLYLQFLGWSAFAAGLALLLPGAALIVLSTRVGSLSDRHGPRRFLAGGPAVMGVGLALFLFVDERSDVWTAGLAGLLLFSLGLALLVAPITTTAISSAPQELAGVASGVNVMVARVGSLVAVAALGLVVALVFEAAGGTAGAVPLAAGQTGESLRSASVDAFRVATSVMVVLCLAGAVVGWLGISDREVLGDRDEAAEARALGGQVEAER